MSGKNRNDDLTGCIAPLLLIIFALPVFGLYVIAKGDRSSEKAGGVLLVITGLVLWVLVFKR